MERVELHLELHYLTCYFRLLARGEIIALDEIEIFLFEKEIFLVYTLIRIPKTRIQVQSNKDNIFNRKSARSQFSKSPTTTSWRISNHWNYIVRMTQRVIKKLD